MTVVPPPPISDATEQTSEPPLRRKSRGPGRLVAAGMLYLIAGLTATGGYCALVVFAALAAHRAWGYGTEWLVVAACLGLTALIGVLLGNTLAKTPPHPSRREQSAPESAPADSNELVNAILERAALDMPPQAWIALISGLVSGLVAIGPRRIAGILGKATIQWWSSRHDQSQPRSGESTPTSSAAGSD